MWAPLGRRTERFAWLRGEPVLVVNIRKAATSKSAEGRLMKTKFTTLVLGSLVAGSLVLSAGPALARDGDRPNNAILLKNPMNDSTRLSMHGKSPMISTA